jgi:hypothetical protein
MGLFFAVRSRRPRRGEVFEGLPERVLAPALQPDSRGEDDSCAQGGLRVRELGEGLAARAAVLTPYSPDSTSRWSASLSKLQGAARARVCDAGCGVRASALERPGGGHWTR